MIAWYLVGEGNEVTDSMSSFEGIHSILQPTEEAACDFLVEVEDAETQVSRTLSVKLIDLIHTEGLHFVCKIKYMNSSVRLWKISKSKIMAHACYYCS